MKKILIIDDDQVVAHAYRHKLANEGFNAEVAFDGESGLETSLTFLPDLIILDLMLPTISGIDVIKAIRADAHFKNTPIIVFSNTYLTTIIQEAWRAGATKSLLKSCCTPQEFVDVVRRTLAPKQPIEQTIEQTIEQPTVQPSTVLSNPLNNTESSQISESDVPDSKADVEFQADLRQSLIKTFPATLYAMRQDLNGLIKTAFQADRLKHVYALCRRVHSLNGNAALAGLLQIAHMAAAFEALLKEVHEKPKNLNASAVRTIAAAVDFLGYLFDFGAQPKGQVPVSKILVVDDDAISRRAVTFALDKAQLAHTDVDTPEKALQLLSRTSYDLIFLDVDMPGMTGYELCAKLRAMPHLQKTPVVFVTALTDLESRANSTMAGGNDFIGKPFLFIELTVKALIYVLKAHFAKTKASPNPIIQQAL